MAKSITVIRNAQIVGKNSKSYNDKNPENPVSLDQHGGAVAVQQITPMAIIQQAVASGMSVEQLGQLMALQERYEATEARKAFNVAMSAFKAAGITVNKNKSVAYLDVKYKHSSLDNVCDTIGEELTKHGLSFRWKTEQTESKIKVTCILMHVMGHSESTEFVTAPDTSGKKNAIQAIGSAITYAQRYTLLSITGTATGDDVDGRDVFDETQLSWYVDAIGKAGTPGELMQAHSAGVSAAQGDNAALLKLGDARNSRLVEIKGGTPAGHPPADVEYITLDQQTAINDMLFEQPEELRAALLKKAGCETVATMRADVYEPAMKWLKNKLGE